MKIKQIYIDQFGKHKGLDIPVDDGFQFVFGHNESGKSTFLQFILCMFYGFDSYNQKNVAKNERLRYTPWHGERFGGFISFEHKGEVYRIERTFGRTSKKDEATLRVAATGEVVQWPEKKELGEWLLGLSKSEFTHSVYIGQLSTVFDNDKEIRKKLIENSGSQAMEMSIESLKKAIEEEKNELASTKRKNYRIGQLETSIKGLEEERALAKDNAEKAKEIRLLIDNLDIELTDLEEEQKTYEEEAAYRRQKELENRAENIGIIEASILEEEAKKTRSLGNLGVKSLEEWQANNVIKEGKDLLDSWKDLAGEKSRYEKNLEELEEKHLSLEARKELEEDLQKVAEFEQNLQAQRNTLFALEKQEAEEFTVFEENKRALETKLSSLESKSKDEAISTNEKQRIHESNKEDFEQKRRSTLAKEDAIQKDYEKSENEILRKKDLANQSLAHSLQSEEKLEEEVLETENKALELENRKTVIEKELTNVQKEDEQVRRAFGKFAEEKEASLLSLQEGYEEKENSLGVGETKKKSSAIFFYFLPAIVLFLVFLVLLLQGNLASVVVVVFALLILLAIVLPLFLLSRQANAGQAKSVVEQYKSLQEAKTREMADIEKRFEEKSRSLANQQNTLKEKRSSLLFEQSSIDEKMNALQEELENIRIEKATLAETIEDERKAIATIDTSLEELKRRYQASLQELTSDEANYLSEEVFSLVMQKENEEIDLLRKALAEKQETFAKERNTLEENLKELRFSPSEEFAEKRKRFEAEKEAVSAALAVVEEKHDRFFMDGREKEESLRALLYSLQKRVDEQESLEAQKEKVSHLLEENEASLRKLLEQHEEESESKLLQDIKASDSLESAEEKLQQFEKEERNLETALAKVEDRNTELSRLLAGEKKENILEKASFAKERFADFTENRAPSFDTISDEIINTRLIESRKRLQENRTEHSSLLTQMQSILQNSRAMQEIDEDLQDVEKELDEVRSSVNDLELALDILKHVDHDLQRSFGPEINRRTAEIFEAITGEQSLNLTIDRDFQAKIEDPESRMLKEIDYFSGGKIDQIYMAMRLAIALTLFEAADQEQLPFIFDDSFVQYDAKRRQEAIKYLARIAREENRQMIFATCHENYLEDNPEIQAITFS